MTRLSVEQERAIRRSDELLGDSLDHPLNGLSPAAHDRRKLLAELDAVREEWARVQASLPIVLTPESSDNILAHVCAERDDLQARLLVMTRERDDLVAALDTVHRAIGVLPGQSAKDIAERTASKIEAFYRNADDRFGEIGYLRIDRDTHKAHAAAAKARAEAAEAQHREDLREIQEEQRARAAVVAQREELAAALEHLREKAGDVVRAAGIGEGEAIVDGALVVALAAARCGPTSEAATSARRGWEAKTRAAVVRWLRARAAVAPHEANAALHGAASELETSKSHLLETKRQGGGT